VKLSKFEIVLALLVLLSGCSNRHKFTTVITDSSLGSNSSQTDLSVDDTIVSSQDLTTPVIDNEKSEIIQLPETFVQTSLNTQKKFSITNPQPQSQLTLSFSAADKNNRLIGQFEIINKEKLEMSYTPQWGFRGKETVVLSISNSSGYKAQVQIHIVVGNTLTEFQPALAVRGMGCIQCHAEVTSNIITDFGYGNSYYMNQNLDGYWWRGGGAYGDHENSFNTMNLSGNKSIFVPQAQLPKYVADETGLTTLASYIRSQFSESKFAGTRQTQVVEKQSVYIGAPTQNHLLAAFQVTALDRIKFFKESDNSYAFSGLLDQGDYFTNQSEISCEGDLYLKGPVYFKQPRFKTRTGCRIYVNGSVFINGPILYTTDHADRNLQISSTESINLGLGSVERNGVLCDPAGPYAVDRTYGSSSLYNRYVRMFTSQSQSTRTYLRGRDLGESVVAQGDLLEFAEGELLDASCSPEGIQVGFDRILLNAPSVQSRYQGHFNGTIIAEFSVMSLGQFKFSFDPVFNRVPVLPFLDKSIYLDIK